MRFYILNSWVDIHCQNVPKTIGTPCISLKIYVNKAMASIGKRYF